MLWVTAWPSPALDIPEAGGADYDTIMSAHYGKWHSGSGFSPCHCRFNVADCVRLTLWDGTPLVQQRIACRRSD